MKATLAILCMLALAVPVDADILNVPEQCPRIQAEIDAAESEDAVLVAAGTYWPTANGGVFPIDMRNGVGLLGAGADVSILDANGTSRVVYCSQIRDPTTRIEGFTITNGKISLLLAGGGICCDESSLIIANNVTTRNSCYFGGGIYCYQSSPTITSNIITGSSRYCSGDGGEIFFNVCLKPTIANNVIAGNDCHYSGGAVACFAASPTIANNIIFANSGFEGGGIWCCDESSPTITFDDVWGNIPDDYWRCEPGVGCIPADPLFVDPTVADYHPQRESPCIHPGDNTAPALPWFDFDGNPRILDGDGHGIAVVSMGAFEFGTPSFELWSQGDPRWAGTLLGSCHGDKTIGKRGCALVSMAMLLKYYGCNTVPLDGGKELNPLTLNEYLNGQPLGFCNEGDINWKVPASLAGLRYLRYGPDIDRLNAELDQRRPVILRVESDTTLHFVLALQRAGDTYSIADPDAGDLTTLKLRYGNEFLSMRVFHHDEGVKSFLCVAGRSPTNLCVTDPEGRHAGVDPLTGGLTLEMPFASCEITYPYALNCGYAPTSIPGSGTQGRVLFSPLPMSEAYGVKAIATAFRLYRLMFGAGDGEGGYSPQTASGIAVADAVIGYEVNTPSF